MLPLGSRVHNSERYDNYGASFGVGDVIGCYINLHDDPALNKMCFFKNGVNQGVAYSGAEIPPGVYYPAVSLYMKVCESNRLFKFLLLHVGCGES